jgi:hypothetical protein
MKTISKVTLIDAATLLEMWAPGCDNEVEAFKTEIGEVRFENASQYVQSCIE